MHETAVQEFDPTLTQVSRKNDVLLSYRVPWLLDPGDKAVLAISKTLIPTPVRASTYRCVSVEFVQDVRQRLLISPQDRTCS